ncbi:hypothetical protein CYLTODRAFT_119285 [Cylindrobasidium torrendii FP15055 ss-10]|uniref:Uncharacterized protein n=1 Tax=Cylindrobasidium torrendii FP15055 ss-10 TaxID=1314674 RepID=A0A0D7B166_9AGAR|nr:hypothetical protein CYLTODRAFT_119285 [Cylindrobasidium torrendii FP15055 ss-10]
MDDVEKCAQRRGNCIQPKMTLWVMVRPGYILVCSLLTLLGGVGSVSPNRNFISRGKGHECMNTYIARVSPRYCTLCTLQKMLMLMHRHKRRVHPT